MRNLKRSVARHNMLRAGYTRLNHKDADGQSKFAKLWRRYV